MEPQKPKRKLSAIFSADVKGYSRLMRDDEAATVRTLTAYRQNITSLIEKYRGRVVDAPGDNLLAEFISVVDAVESAAEIQKEIKVQNADLPDGRKMEFRIGINVGDVIEERDRIYGDGVNIAARMEALAEAGGICISGDAYRQVRNKLDLGFEDMGEQEVKNIPEPVHAYRVLMEPGAAGTASIPARRNQWRWALAAVVAVVVLGGAAVWNFYLKPPPIELASVEKMAFPLPKKPSIAVLPFTNMSGDPKQVYFSDGMTDDLITDLSKVSGLFVIASNSVFAYKGKAVKVQKVAEDLGVRYVLEGSVRRVGDKVRINAQLIDATTGGHIWAERYDRDMKNIFTLQDEITEKIVAALEVKLTEGEKRQVQLRYTDNLEAYDLYLQGREYQLRGTKGYKQARQLFEKAIELDPKFAAAYAELSFVHWTFLKMKALDQTFESAQRAVALDDSLPLAHTRLAWAYLRKRQYEQAIREGKRALALDPNFAEGYSILGEILNSADRPKEGLEFVKKAMRLNPHYPASYLYRLGQSYWVMGQNQKAIAIIERARSRNPKDKPPLMHLAILYSETDQMEKARAGVEAILKLIPMDSLELENKICAYEPGLMRRFLDGLRKAGLPEKSMSTAL